MTARRPATAVPGVPVADVYALRLILAMIRLAEETGEAIAGRVGDRELIGNAPIAVMAGLMVRGTLRPAEIAAMTGFTSGGVTKLLDRLEGAGLISRAFGQVPRDRRAIVVSLTPAGQEHARLIAAMLVGHAPLIRDLLADLTTLLDELDANASPGH